MIFSNALFTLPTVCHNILGKLTALTICKWATIMLGTVCNLGKMPDYILREAPSLVYTYTFNHLIQSFGFIVIHTVIYIIAAWIRLKMIKRERVF